MNFRQATDALLESVTLQDLADAMGISVQSVRQARTVEGSTAHRAAPPKWESAVARVAVRHSQKLSRLAARLVHNP